MRFARTSALSLLAAGSAWALGWGCAGKDTSSTFATGTGTNSGPGSGPGPGAGGGIGTSSGTNTTTGIVPPVTGTTGSGGGSVNPDANCGSTRQGTKQIPVDVFIMQDKSGSMTCSAADDACQNGMGAPPTRWDAMGQALTTFVDSPAPTMAGVAIGIGFFPGNGGGCQAGAYATPTVPIAPLPGNATPIKNAIAANMPNGGTPTTPALQGAIQYAKAYTMASMGMRTAAVLLVTDGVPTGCNPNTPATAAAAAMAGFNGTPQIKTFVVGMGDTAALDQIALAGSGGMTHYIPTMGDVVGTLTNALTAITGMITCSYTIPTGSDPRLVNVEITVGSGMPQKIGKVDNAGACPAGGGWYYDSNTAPTMIILCPQSCDAIKGTPNSGVQVLYGCPSIPPA